MQKPKGTFDIIEDIQLYHMIEKTIRKMTKRFSVQEIRTPHFEHSELYHRSVGESTDVVGKETYRFLDRGGRDITLRPEGTAGVVRAYVENKLYANPQKVQKYYYVGSMFRYERPQKGRFREFNTFGVEAFGSGHPKLDAEIIELAYRLTFLLGIQPLVVHLNSLGDAESKTRYKEALQAHLAPHLATLCDDCKTRFETNPLRILDCKVDAKHEALLTAPKPFDYLVAEDKDHFDQVVRYLTAQNIPYHIDDRLVRGLDYYTHTVFEIKTDESLLGQQNTLCGGGRYNHLVEALGGPSTPAVGFGFGLERLIVAIKAAQKEPLTSELDVYIGALGNEALEASSVLATKLRKQNLSVESSFEPLSLKAQFKQSDRLNARFFCLLGEDEVRAGTVSIKDQKTKEEATIKQAQAAFYIIDKLTHDQTCVDCEEGA